MSSMIPPSGSQEDEELIQAMAEQAAMMEIEQPPAVLGSDPAHLESGSDYTDPQTAAQPPPEEEQQDPMAEAQMKAETEIGKAQIKADTDVQIAQMKQAAPVMAV